MTLLVALQGQDGLVLAADSRVTFGYPSATTAQNDSMQKAHILARHVAVLAAGANEVRRGACGVRVHAHLRTLAHAGVLMLGVA